MKKRKTILIVMLAALMIAAQRTRRLARQSRRGTRPLDG
jgi:hypothetical protein